MSCSMRDAWSLKKFFKALAERIRELWDRLIEPVDRLWDKFKGYFGSVVKPCRFSVLMLSVVLLFFWFAPQGQDVLRAMGESKEIKKIIIFYAALVWCAVNIWYWGRIMLRYNFRDPLDLVQEQKERNSRTRMRFPRILGFLAFIICALSFFKASAAYSEPGLTADMWTLIGLGILCLLLGCTFYIAVIIRSRISKKLHNKLKRRKFAGKAIFKGIVGGLDMDTSDTAYDAKYTTLRDLPPLTRAMLISALMISVVLFLLFIFRQNAAASVGAATIVLLAAASWVAVGSVLVYWGTQNSFPALTALLLLAIPFSSCNDNHLIRIWTENSDTQAALQDTAPAAGAYDFKNWLFQRRTRTVENDFGQWLTGGDGGSRLARWDREKKDAKDKEINDARKHPHPVFVVAAEGGGIRAAYWTALVLSELQKRNSGFADHVYAMSGVSGGSLGISVFAALAAQDVDHRQTRNFAEAILGHDFLAPTVAYMLYPDLLQRIIPWPVYSFDRGRALEQSWEGAWKEEMKNDNFSKPFHTLYWGMDWRSGERSSSVPGSVPRLFLNSTWVETGKRVIASNLKIDSNTFRDAVDFFDVVQAPVLLSSAVHNSARFTYVSPAGKVLTPDGKKWGHLVDGGYFENSGATTAHEVLSKMQSSIDDEIQERIIPVVIMIINDPIVPAIDECREQINGRDKSCNARRVMNEVLSPLIALMNTRGARGSYARNLLKSLATDKSGKKDNQYVQYWKFSLKQGKIKKKPLPLGWMLSQAAKDNMNSQLQEILDNELNINDPLILPKAP